jgi:hypothetical protein
VLRSVVLEHKLTSLLARVGCKKKIQLKRAYRWVTGPRYRYWYKGHRLQIKKQLTTWSGISARWPQDSVGSLDSDSKEL